MTDLPDDQTPSTPPANLLRRLAPAVVVLGASGALIWALDRPASVGMIDDQDLAADLATSTTAPDAGTSPSTVPGRPGATTSTVAPAPTCSGTTRTINGTTISTRFGPVQVAAIVEGSTLCSVSAPQYPAGDRRSQQINARAIPILNERALATGSTSFAGVSGATYTYNAYRQSLQSVLDQL